MADRNLAKSPANDRPTIEHSTAIGLFGVLHLRRLWSAAMATRRGEPIARDREGDLDRLVVDALGLGLHQLFEYLYSQAPTFADFEAWIVETAGAPDRLQTERLNADITGQPPPKAVQRWLDVVDRAEPALTNDQLDGWEANGYVVLPAAVPDVARAAAALAIGDFIGSDPDRRDSWNLDSGQSIMVEPIQHRAFDATRRSERVHKAFAQLWGTADLWY
jgi:hypothetical protein